MAGVASAGRAGARGDGRAGVVVGLAVARGGCWAGCGWRVARKLREVAGQALGELGEL